jgi:hypothetical protein
LDYLSELYGLWRLNEFFDNYVILKEQEVATFVFEKGGIPAEELALAMNSAMKGQNGRLRGAGDCLKVEERVVAVIHEKTVPESVIFVDKDENLPFIEAAREVTYLREFNGID